MNIKLIRLAIASLFIMLAIAPMATAQPSMGAIAEPPTQYIYVRNVSGHTVENGEYVVWATATTVGYGYDIIQNAGASSSLVAGIAAQDIPTNSYGIVLVSGYHPAVKVDVQNRDIAIGDGLVPSGGQFTLSSTDDSNTWRQIVALETESVSTEKDGIDNASDYAQDAASPPTVRAVIRCW